MKPFANEREARAAQIRLEALSEDWRRLRDIEHEWRGFSRWTYRVAALMVMLALLFWMVGCDSREKKCARWRAVEQSYEMCAAEAPCRGRFSRHDYKRWDAARIERAHWCAEERP